MDNVYEILLREKCLKELDMNTSDRIAFRKGFSAAMELQLPVLFVEYLHRQKIFYNDTLEAKEWFDYWLENIYPTQQP